MNQPIIENNGKVLSISFDNLDNSNNFIRDNFAVPQTNSSSFPSRRTTTRFHAAWLWHNDSRNVMIPSGQKKYSASSWWSNQKPILVKASIHHVEQDQESLRLLLMGTGEKYEDHHHHGRKNQQQQEDEDEDEEVCSCCFVTPKGSIHPMTMAPTTTSDCKSATCPFTNATTDRTTTAGSNQQTELEAYSRQRNVPSNYVLVITWRSAAAAATTSSSPSSSLTSIFNLQWLMDWSNPNHDDDDIHDNMMYHSARIQREVSTKHTFIHAYKQAQTLPFQQDECYELSRRTCHDGLICVDYHDLLKHDSTCVEQVLPFLDALFLEGAVVVRNAPLATHACPEHVVTQIGKVISGGALSHGSLYGDTFHVKSTRDAINVAYTSHELCPHQDLAYYESKPGFQLLFCASMPPNIMGGESLLIDCMAAAHAFREMAPDLFETLVKCSACFVKDRKGARMTYSRPHIVLHADGISELNDIHREIVSVHWSPPFEGPIPTLRPEAMEEYLKAYAAFELMLDNTKCPLTCSEATGIDLDLAMKLAAHGKEFTWQKLLKPGEILVFNNTRMLHGRRKFEMPRWSENRMEQQRKDDAAASQETMMERHLVGGYTNIDDSLNRYRTLLKEANIHRIIPNVGNGTVSVLP